jgi:LmbE family N-acetylglucosaminyl deacetylase
MSLWSQCPQMLKPYIRKGVRFFVLWRLRLKSQPLAPSVPKTVTIIVAPHQDDCAFGCAGVIARRISSGDTVLIAYLTDGSASHRGHPDLAPAELVRIRAAEAQASASVLGIGKDNLKFFGAPDGELAHLGSDARGDLLRRLGEHIDEMEATEIFITSAGDGSTEHEAAYSIVVDALELLKRARPTLLEYPIWALWSPMRLINLARGARVIYRLALRTSEREKKAAAIHSFSSQLLPLPPWEVAALPKGFAETFGGRDEFFFERSLEGNKFQRRK